MLTAWDQSRETIIALPDYETAAALGEVREWARAERVLCPVCREKLWLRVGEKRSAHLAHRVLADCPHARVSVAVIETRRLLYRFFQERLGPDKIAGPIELETIVPGLPDGTCLDLILRRGPKEAVAIVILEAGLKPDPRWELGSATRNQSLILRPVFLTSTLRRKNEAEDVYLLNPTQREMAHKSRFGLREDSFGLRDSLHFVDYERVCWTSLRGLWLEHEPQVYRTESVRHSAMNELLWSESEAEWTHLGEFKAKQPPTPTSPAPIISLPQQRFSARSRPTSPTPRSLPKDESPAWITEGLVCIGCGLRTHNWSNAVPETDRCVCKACVAKGIR